MSGGHNYDLYIINTSKNIRKILDILGEITDNEMQVGPIRKDFERNQETKNYTELQRKLIILRRDIFVKIDLLLKSKDKINDFEVIRYKLKKENYAFPKTSCMHFYYPLSKDVDCNKVISDKMNFLQRIGMINDDEWYVHEAGICEFSNTVPDKTRVIIKIMMDYPGDFRVSWCRKIMFSKIVQHFTNEK